MLTPLFAFPNDFLASSTAFAGQIFEDFKLPILLLLAVSLAMWVMAFWVSGEFGGKGERILTGKEIAEELEEEMAEIEEEEEEEEE